MSYSNSNIKLSLIELVCVNDCIYNPKHKHYKNKAIKFMLWEDIGAKLNIEASKARELWRSLRDGYIRYKKAIKTGKKHAAYSWSDHLSFLDEVLEAKDGDNPQETSQQQVYFSEDVFGKMSSPSQQVAEIWVDSVASSPTQDLNAEPTPSYIYQQSEQSSKKRKTDTIDKVIGYLQSKKKKEHDAVDLLFMSYAKSFKSLSARKQAKVKVTLAKVFAEAEFGDLESETIND